MFEVGQRVKVKRLINPGDVAEFVKRRIGNDGEVTSGTSGWTDSVTVRFADGDELWFFDSELEAVDDAG